MTQLEEFREALLLHPADHSKTFEILDQFIAGTYVPPTEHVLDSSRIIPASEVGAFIMDNLPKSMRK